LHRDSNQGALCQLSESAILYHIRIGIVSGDILSGKLD
jgi:hypothetical protein